MRAALLLLLSVLCWPLQAALVSDLYSAEVNVDGRNNSARVAGVKAALEQVLIRVTGNAEVAKEAAGRSVLSRADNYMLTYAFQSAGTTTLQVRFDQAKLNQKLQQVGLPIWGSQRPVTIHWLAVSDDQQPLSLTNELSDDGEAIAEIAKRRGVPQLLPMLDLEDSLAVGANDILGNFPKPVLQASARYGSDFVLLSSVQLIDEQWHYQLYLYDANEPSDAFAVPRALQQQGGMAASREAALDQLIAITASYYAGRYGAVASDIDLSAGDQMVFELNGGMRQLVELERYLQSLTPVQQTSVIAVEGNQIRLQLKLVGGLAEVQQLLALEARVQPFEVATDEFQPTQAVPHYRWLNQ